MAQCSPPMYVYWLDMPESDDNRDDEGWSADGKVQRPDTASLWDAVSGFDKPLLFVRGMRPQSVVGDEDEAELVKRAPHAHVEHFAEAGHSVQGDMPVELAAVIRDFAGL